MSDEFRKYKFVNCLLVLSSPVPLVWQLTTNVE